MSGYTFRTWGLMEARRFGNWNLVESEADKERSRIAFLRKPPDPNPEHLLELVSVRILKPFMVKGKRVEVGEVVRLQRHDAESMMALKKCQPVKG